MESNSTTLWSRPPVFSLSYSFVASVQASNSGNSSCSITWITSTWYTMEFGYHQMPGYPQLPRFNIRAPTCLWAYGRHGVPWRQAWSTPCPLPRPRPCGSPSSVTHTYTILRETSWTYKVLPSLDFGLPEATHPLLISGIPNPRLGYES